MPSVILLLGTDSRESLSYVQKETCIRKPIYTAVKMNKLDFHVSTWVELENNVDYEKNEGRCRMISLAQYHLCKNVV